MAPSPGSVSCQCGSRGTRLVRSAANNPRTAMRGRGIGNLRPDHSGSVAGIDDDIDAPVLLTAFGIVVAIGRLVRRQRSGLAVALDRRVDTDEPMAAKPLAYR